ncbi:similar to Saccharomyces cerevisiae YBL001C ECM15 Non-essential protein of unknown function [Maudiozyma barnettii]|uniref:Thiamine-binding protein domain-containing protein n=1 Tax=Maudiozyma barnettii TaxID=61262 RepID=A0A8H2VJJ7_9SACH|nr:uncharacterized protein KABA2_12S02574 [Kazachstania barnettii]CAB4256931.1 similar to Saccharomyces cerevisiae YBL001C ECM15 Non-essential protein of unknown function [Kazachstania barnettii]CAD1785536.1 similar to Saccharomyces cerevisiae YBL001C ECM15 Non-essential protein of unknown function [Kazachstania barnettii]
MYCIADVCIVPVGTSEVSGSSFIAGVEKKIQESSLKSTLHSAGTTIEGPWKDVTNLIGELHEYSHSQGVMRVHSDIRIGTRIDKEQTAQDKVDVVLTKLQQKGI